MSTYKKVGLLGGSGGSSGGSGIATGTVNTVDDLPVASTVTGQVYYVENTKLGLSWPFLKRYGFYKSDGTNWVKTGITQADIEESVKEDGVVYYEIPGESFFTYSSTSALNGGSNNFRGLRLRIFGVDYTFPSQVNFILANSFDPTNTATVIGQIETALTTAGITFTDVRLFNDPTAGAGNIRIILEIDSPTSGLVNDIIFQYFRGSSTLVSDTLNTVTGPTVGASTFYRRTTINGANTWDTLNLDTAAFSSASAPELSASGISIVAENKLLNGFIYVADNQYTTSSRLSISSGVRTKITNDAQKVNLNANKPAGPDMWNPSTNQLVGIGQNDTYGVRFRCVADPTLNNRNFTIEVEIDAPTNAVVWSKTIRLARGAGVDTAITEQIELFSGFNYQANGASIYVTCDGDVDLFDINFFIEKRRDA